MKLPIPLLLLLFACQKSQPQTDVPKEIAFEGSPQAITITGSKIPEASGITYSNTMKGALWVNQDSGNQPYLYLLGSDGSVKDSVMIEGITNRDWEEVVLAAGPSENKSFIYIGDIGDNQARYPDYTIYRFEEPAEGEKTVTGYDRLTFTYEDGARDAEAFLIEKRTKDIYVISKRETKSRLYRLAYPQRTDVSNVATFVMELPYMNVVSAATSPADDAIIVKTYTHVYYYPMEAGASIVKTLESPTPRTLQYQLEPQGEAITFAHDGNGFYTLSEEAMGVVPKLFFYRKK